MISYISDKLLQFLVSGSAITDDSENRDYYKYGLEITISSLLGLIIIIAISLLYGSIACGLIFIAIFVPLRQLTGGWHAKSYFRCNLTFAISFTAVLTLYRFLPAVNNSIYVIVTFFDIVIILLFCPVVNKNKPIGSRLKKNILKAASVAVFSLESCFSIMLIFSGNPYGRLVCYVLQLIIILIIIAKAEERREKYEKAKQKSSQSNGSSCKVNG